MKRTFLPARRASRALAPLALAAVALTACGSSSTSSSSTLALAPRVVITSVKGDPKSELLAAMYARVLGDAGFRISMKDPVALDRAGFYAALQNDDFQLIPDFTADLQKFLYNQPGAPTAPTTVAPGAPATTQARVTVPTTVATPDTSTGATDAATTTTAVVINNGRSTSEQLTAIKAALAKNVTVGNASTAEDKQVVACTAAAIKANAKTQLVTLTDLAAIAPSITLGGSAAFMADKEFGLPAFTNLYGGTFNKTVTVEDSGLADAIKNAAADCFVMNSMNPLITTDTLTVLNDDKVMVPSNAAVALVSTTIAVDTLRAAIDTLNASLTTARLNQMVNEVVANGTAPSVVANAFMNTL